jgi:hypothetical protein
MKTMVFFLEGPSEIENNRSHSFKVLVDGIRKLMEDP